MDRKHLFAIVVLLGAAAVAGLLALTRTTTATQASSTQIAAKTRSLDRLEASLRRSLAEQPPAFPATTEGGGQSVPARTVYVRSSPAAQAPSGEHEEDDEYEREDSYEGADG